mmetsp:Transcript_37493/g.61215  ORF Transcript_37493/g.61215 Transcript_37493/m.61215 type:complete len:93 (+) Transcript_37493:76-354(+)
MKLKFVREILTALLHIRGSACTSVSLLINKLVRMPNSLSYATNMSALLKQVCSNFDSNPRYNRSTTLYQLFLFRDDDDGSASPLFIPARCRV